MERLLLYAYQDVTLDEPGTDCGTKRYVTVNLTNDNVADWMYCYIIDGDKLVELTSDNMNKYIGKKVKVRFSSLCENKMVKYAISVQVILIIEGDLEIQVLLPHL